MAPLKFRAWDTLKKKMFPVKALALGYCDDMGFKGPEVLLMKGEPYDDEDMPNSLRGKSWDTAPTEGSSQYRTCIVMQSTGLKDKNGVEVYEGDVVTKDSSVNAEVFYRCPAFCVKLKVPTQKNAFAGYGFADGGTEVQEHWADLDADCEVIGNIYQNPDLLQ